MIGKCRNGHVTVSQYYGKDSFDRYWTDYHKAKSIEIEDMRGYKENPYSWEFTEEDVCEGYCSMCMPLDPIEDYKEPKIAERIELPKLNNENIKKDNPLS